MLHTSRTGMSAWTITAIVLGCFLAAVLAVGLMALFFRPRDRRREGIRAASASPPAAPTPAPLRVPFEAVGSDSSLEGHLVRVEGYYRATGRLGSTWWINLVATPGKDSSVIVCGVDADPSSSLGVGQRVAVEGTLRGAVIKPCTYEAE